MSMKKNVYLGPVIQVFNSSYGELAAFAETVLLQKLWVFSPKNNHLYLLPNYNGDYYIKDHENSEEQVLELNLNKISIKNLEQAFPEEINKIKKTFNCDITIKFLSYYL